MGVAAILVFWPELVDGEMFKMLMDAERRMPTCTLISSIELS